ncbi:hypothetical protein V6R21_12560 [Limibacter armeniacum]|uniref:hypothetical protein n=1 Tax=Limibacter armeniacum TaxID=466084 RepID=UPI002FE5788E
MKKISNLLLLLTVLLVVFSGCQNNEDDIASPSKSPNSNKVAIDFSFSTSMLSNARVAADEIINNNGNIVGNGVRETFGECDLQVDAEYWAYIVLESDGVALDPVWLPVVASEVTDGEIQKFYVEGLSLIPEEYVLTCFIIYEENGDNGGLQTDQDIIKASLPISGAYADFVNGSDGSEDYYTFVVRENSKMNWHLEVLCINDADMLSQFGYLFANNVPVSVKRLYFYTNYCEGYEHKLASMRGRVLCGGEEVIFRDRVWAVQEGNGATWQGTSTQLVNRNGNPDYLCLAFHNGSNCGGVFTVQIELFEVAEEAGQPLSELENITPTESQMIEFSITYDQICDIRDGEATWADYFDEELIQLLGGVGYGEYEEEATVPTVHFGGELICTPTSEEECRTYLTPGTSIEEVVESGITFYGYNFLPLYNLTNGVNTNDWLNDEVPNPFGSNFPAIKDNLLTATQVFEELVGEEGEKLTSNDDFEDQGTVIIDLGEGNSNDEVTLKINIIDNVEETFLGDVPSTLQFQLGYRDPISDEIILIGNVVEYVGEATEGEQTVFENESIGTLPEGAHIIVIYDTSVESQFAFCELTICSGTSPQ